MKTTFMCDETMVITIPIGSVKGIRGSPSMPEKFQCVYKDFYKVFVINGKPKPLGAAQAITGLFIVALAITISFSNIQDCLKNLPSLVFVVAGLLSFAAGQAPNIHVSKLSFALNIICFFWSVAAIVMNALITSSLHYRLGPREESLQFGTHILIVILLVVELFTSLHLIYWLSKAICRQHFNLLPVVLLKQVD